jgi:hypothetical protein
MQKTQPAENQKSQNCSVPLRFTPQFSPIIQAALFYAAVSPQGKNSSQKPGQKSPVTAPHKTILTVAYPPSVFSNHPAVSCAGLFNPAVFRS